MQNITRRAGKAAPKVYLPHRRFHLPRHSVKQRWVTLWGLCPFKHCLLSVANKGLVLLAQLPFFCQIHIQLAIGQVVMLHAVITTFNVHFIYQFSMVKLSSYWHYEFEYASYNVAVCFWGALWLPLCAWYTIMSVISDISHAGHISSVMLQILVLSPNAMTINLTRGLCARAPHQLRPS